MNNIDNSLLLHAHAHADQRGLLCVINRQDIPFAPKRVFWISQVPEGQSRGGHAHRTCAEAIFAICGSVQIMVDNGNGQTQPFLLNSPDQGLYIGPNVWCELTHFSKDCVCVVLASEDYDTEGYIYDYDHFRHA